MATKKTLSSRGKAVAKKQGVRRAKAADENGSPVTLEEAQRIAGISSPSRAGRNIVDEGPSQDGIAVEQERYREARAAERARRFDEYKATMEVMKARGARRSDGRAVAPGVRREAFVPLQIMAEGDSWFDYPVPFKGNAIIKRLQRLIGVPILNMAEAGDEVRFMLGVEQRRRLIKALKDGCPAGGPWDTLLFSGGGNDIVDNPMALWIRDWDPTIAPIHLLDSTRFAAALAIVRAGYEDLIALRDRLSPNTHLVLHGYDFAIPDGRGVCGKGPWLMPSFDLHGFPETGTSRREVVHEMLLQFAAMVKSLSRSNVSYVNTQGVLSPDTKGWANELHPTPKGFQTFAELFCDHLKQRFPDRVA
jgi:hypothetical protein